LICPSSFFLSRSGLRSGAFFLYFAFTHSGRHWNAPLSLAFFFFFIPHGVLKELSSTFRALCPPKFLLSLDGPRPIAIKSLLLPVGILPLVVFLLVPKFLFPTPLYTTFTSESAPDQGSGQLGSPLFLKFFFSEIAADTPEQSRRVESFCTVSLSFVPSHTQVRPPTSISVLRHVGPGGTWHVILLCLKTLTVLCFDGREIRDNPHGVSVLTVFFLGGPFSCAV